MKRCIRCRKRKPKSEFPKHIVYKSGLGSRCKKCCVQLHKNHKKEAVARKKEWYKNHKEEKAITNKEYQIAHKEELAIKAKKRYENNKKQVAVTGKRWRENNPEKAAKRRELGFNLLNKKFEGSVAHHINIEDVIYIPGPIHKSVSHNVRTGRNMDAINKIAVQYL